ncbi:MAG: efflux RND transporter periplasmic adaptor subunit [Chloroflexi bacterium]|nr:efflux RND transporter periplasmic adaptor subunit [Chloroflexota bacterium]
MSKRKLSIGIVILVILVGAGAFYFWQQQQAAARSASTQRQTATLTRGALVATVNGGGNIYAPQQTNLNFGVSGVSVTHVNVKVGDKVKQGVVLAQVDDAQLQDAFKTAEANLASAQANFDSVQAPPTAEEQAIAQAQARAAAQSYNSAVAKLDTLKAPPSALDLQASRAQLAAAQASYASALAQSQLRDQQILVERAAVEKARVALEAAQSAYNAVAWRDDAPNSSQAQALQTATIDYETAKANFDLQMAQLSDSSLKSAEASLAQAKTNLITLTEGATKEELASAQAAVDQALQSWTSAKKSLQDLKDGPTQPELTAAQASLQSAKANYEAAKRNLDNAKIIAPFDGTIAAVNIVVGQTPASGTTAMVLSNLDDLQLQLALSEVDIAQVKPGQQVQLTFDALGTATYPSQVISVSPVGASSQGVVNYTVTVGLTNPDPAILPGMSASAGIVIAEQPDALLAPNRAVRTQGTRKIMTILFEGNENIVVVRTGLTNDQYTEIISAATTDGAALNLQEGDTVLLNATTTNSGNNFPGGGGFIFGGPPSGGR